MFFSCRMILLLSAVECAASLQCWKCIADNCEEDPDGNYKAVKMTCASERSSCMKVEYSLDHNHTGNIRRSVVRTCSAGPCVPVTDNQFSDCATKKNHHVLGCIKRQCCDDRDMCNGGRSGVINVGMFLILISVSFIGHILDH
ncbi:uncharacterized protein LOC124287956 [Haliotis rubra]|uniref:uncharacterized protein LOC124287956 n=1 Tax=Haliotis rubra TaxID=36100 RepID=UPI001EE635AD|nr:uncharacterized protein LOC124287956 [Haliotis rubra]